MMYNKTDKQGFVILVAVVVATVIVSLGAFIASIAIKELELSSSGRESQDAFYAADAAMECALYHDFRVEQFGSNFTDPLPVECNDTFAAIVIGTNANGTPSDTSNSVTYYEVTFTHPDIPTVDESPYARVRVIKENVGTINDKTIIESQGYNVRSAGIPGRVQRALQVVY